MEYARSDPYDIANPEQLEPASARGAKEADGLATVKDPVITTGSTENSLHELAWLNHAIANIWPQCEQAAQTVMDNKVMPVVRAKILGKSDKVKDIRFSRFGLGAQPPRIAKIKTTSLQHGSCKMKCHMVYDSDTHFELQVDTTIIGSVKLGIKDIKVEGDMIFILRPYEEESPDIGSLSFYFVEAPKIDFDFSGHVDFLTTLGLDDLVIKAMAAALEKKLVLPNMITVNVNLKDFKVFPPVFEKPNPIGVLRLRLLRGTRGSAAAQVANDVKPKKPGLAARIKKSVETVFEYVDNKIGESTGKDMQEYLEFRVGETIWNPKLVASSGETFDFLVHEMEQQLKISVWDTDFIGSDDLMGEAVPIDLQNVPAASGKDIPLISREDGTPWATVSFHVDYKKVRPKAEGKSECMVMIGILDLTQRKGNLQGKKLAVRAQIGEQQTTTPAGSVLKGVQEKDDVKKLLADIRQQLMDSNVDQAAIDKAMAVTSPPRVSINTTLHLPCPTSALSSQELELSLIEIETTSKKETIHHVVGKAKRKLKLAELRGAKEYKMSHEQVEFESSLGDIAAQLSITLCALDSTTPAA